MASRSVRARAETDHHDLPGTSGEGVAAVFAGPEGVLARTPRELGAAGIDPASLGVERP